MEWNLFYEYLDLIFSKSFNTNLSIKSQKIVQVITAFIIMCQNFRLAWKFDLEIPSTNNFSSFWQILSYSSIENLCAYSGSFKVFSLILLSIPLATLTLIIFHFALMHFFRKHIKILTFLIKSSLAVQDTLLLIPITLTCLVIIKYSTSTGSEIKEILNRVDSNNVDYGDMGAIISSMSLVTLIIFLILHQGFNYEISHSETKQKLNCRLSYYSALVKIILTIIRCLLYLEVSGNNYKTYLIITLFTYLVQGLVYLAHMPYYDMFMNILMILKALQGALFSLAFFMGVVIDNANIIFFLTLILQPWLIIFVFTVCRLREENFKCPNDTSTLKFEQFFRDKLKNQEVIPNFFKKTRKQFEISKNQLIVIIEALYCHSVINNSMLGLNKLSEFKRNPLNIFENFQVFKARTRLQQTLEPSEAIKTVIFLNQLHKIIESEKKYSKSLEKLSIEMHQAKPLLVKLKDSLTNISKSKNLTKKSYKQLLEFYPNSFIGYEMFGTFLVNILHNPINGIPILEKAKIEKESNSDKKNIFSTLTSNLMLVSCDKHDFGKVLYLSESLCELFKVDRSESKHCYLKDFVPEPFSKPHDMLMSKFLKYSESNKFTQPDQFVMLTKEDYLIECKLNSECVTKDKTLLFVIEIKKLTLNREVVLMSEDGHIYAHSKGFSSLIGHRDINYKGKNVHVLFNKQLVQDQLNIINITHEVTGCQIEISIYFIKMKVISTDMFFLYCSTDTSYECLLKNNTDMNNIRLNKSTKKTFKISSNYQHINEKNFSITIGETGISKSQSTSSLIKNTRNDTFSKIGKYFMIIKVLFYIMTLVLLILSIIIIIYTNDQVTHSISLDSINIFGYYKYSTCYFSLISLNLHLTNTIQVPLFFTNDEILSVKEDLTTNKKELLKRFKGWRYCDASKLFTANDFVIYLRNTTKTSNFIDEMLVLDSIAEIIYNQVKAQQTDYDDEIFYMIINMMRMSYIDFDLIHNEITKCEQIKVEMLKDRIFMIFNTGFILIGSMIVLQLLIVALLQKNLNSAWHILYKRSKRAFSMLEKNLKERFETIHKQLPQNKKSDVNLHKPSSFDEFSHFIFYFWRFLPFFILTSVFYFLGTLYYYEAINHLLIKRIIFNNIELDIRSSIMQISFFMLLNVEKLHIGSEDEYLKKFNPYKDSKIEQLIVEGNINAIRDQYLNTDLRELYTDSIWSMFFDTCPNQENFLKLGLINAYSHITQESFNLTSQKPSLVDLSTYFIKIRTLASIFKSINNELISNSNTKINKIITNFIIFSISLVFITAFSAIFIYRPFLSSEERTVKNIENFISTLPIINKPKK